MEDLGFFLLLLVIFLAPFILIFLPLKIFLFPQKDKVLKDVAETTGMVFKSHPLGVGKVAGSYKNFPVLIKVGGDIDAPQAIIGAAVANNLWVAGLKASTQIIVTLPKKVGAKVVEKNIFVSSNRLTYAFPGRGAVSGYKFETKDDIIKALEEAIEQSRKL